MRAVEFAAALDVPIVLYKAATRSAYIQHARRVLDAVEQHGRVAVLQNHFGSAVESLDHVHEVLDGVNDDRLGSLLEVGQFHSAGVHWRTAQQALGNRVALVHIKDQIGRQSVPFGTGEVDLAGLFAHMHSVGYTGDYVIEMEVADAENTMKYLADAITYVEPLLRTP